MIDTHCHLDAAEFAVDRDQIAAQALALGVKRMVVPAVAVNSFPGVKSCVARYPACAAAYGIHPLYVMQAREQDITTLGLWLGAERALAVGEIGLDFFVGGIDQDRQIHFFTEQLKLARQFELPVILHVRQAIDAVLSQLRRHRVCGGIAHAFNGSRQQADQFIEMGFKLGFGGAMTYPGSTRIRGLAATLPLESIVLETDAPDIPPEWLNRGRNSPAELPRIAAALAALRRISLEEVVLATSRAARQALPGLAESSA
jgi:TatD DNase family protein